MSVGILCQCPRPEHGERPANIGPGPGCSRYAANQELGGVCVSCSYGWHRPCDLLRLEAGAIAGVCRRCRWHSSDHRR